MTIWKKLKLVAWVLGIYSCFNLALLARQAWRVISSLNDPWVRITYYIFLIVIFLLGNAQEPLGRGVVCWKKEISYSKV